MSSRQIHVTSTINISIVVMYYLCFALCEYVWPIEGLFNCVNYFEIDTFEALIRGIQYMYSIHYTHYTVTNIMKICL